MMEQGHRSQVVKAAGLLMVTMIISRILGYLRDVFIYAQFGQNRVTDAYTAAFSIPDFIYMILVGGALSAAFIPVFSSYIATGKEEDGWKVASIVFNWIAIFLAVCLLIGYLFTPQLIRLLVPGFDPRAMEMTVSLTRIMFFQVIFMSLSGISMGILNSFKHFTSPAIGSVLYNLGIILGGLLLAAPIEAVWPGYGIAGFSIGVVIGAAANFFVQVPALRHVGLRYSLSLDFNHPGVKRLILLMMPVFIGLSVSQINLFINQNLASMLPEGIVAALRSAQRIMQMPIGIFAIAIAMAVFPTLTSQAARGEIKEFKQTASLGIRSVIYITLPCAVGLAVLRVPIIRFIFEFSGGRFTHEATLATAEALLFYSIGLFAYGAIHVLSRTFYALQDTFTPVLAAVCSIGVNIAFSLLLVRPMAQGGLALAYSLAGIFNMLFLLYLLRRKTGSIDGKALLTSFCRTAVACAVMGGVAWAGAYGVETAFGVHSKLFQALQLIAAIGLGGVAYFAVTYLWDMEEARQVISIFRRRLRRNKITRGES